MFLQRSLRPQSALRAVSASTRSILPRSQERGLHGVPQLTFATTFKKDGITEFLSPPAYHMAWDEYQGLLVNKLNLFTAGTTDENESPSSLLIKYARDSTNAAIFNYASMAHNNHFFFNCLTPNTTQPSPTFLREIEDSCSSLESLKADLSTCIL